MQNIIILLLPLVLLVACGHSDPDGPDSDNRVASETETDTTIANYKLFDTLSNETAVLPSIEILMQLAAERMYRTESIVVSDPQTIRTYEYISSSFDTDKIDSLEFYGSVSQYYQHKKRMPYRSMLFVYFNDAAIAENQLIQLQTNWENNFRGIESMFKAGGIGLTLNGQLCVYSIDACAAGYKNVLHVDSLIAEKVFNGKPFTRIHSKCGMGPLILLEQ